MAEVRMPQLGESVTEGTITKWFKAVGDRVETDEVLFEVSTDKVDSEVPSPQAGYVAEIKVPEGETVEVGVVLVVLSDEAPGAAAPAAPSAVEIPPPAAPEPVAPPAPGPAPVSPGFAADSTARVSEPPEARIAATSAPAPAPAAAHQGPSDETEPRLLSPVVRRLLTENQLDPAAIVGTGLGGRITREDVLAVIDARASGGASASAAAPATPVASVAPVAPVPEAPAAAQPVSPTPSAAPVHAGTRSRSSVRASETAIQPSLHRTSRQ